jgi:hypothetical protein
MVGQKGASESIGGLDNKDSAPRGVKVKILIGLEGAKCSLFLGIRIRIFYVVAFFIPAEQFLEGFAVGCFYILAA